MAATEWNTLQPRIIGPNGATPTYDFPEGGSTQTFKAGTPVKLSSGQAVIATDGTTGLLGIAQETASGTQTTMRKVQVVRPHTDYIIAHCVNAGTAALASTFTVATAYDFYVDSDSVFHADAGATDGPILIFVQPIYDVNGDSTYWGIFQLLAGQAGNLDSAGA